MWDFDTRLLSPLHVLPRGQLFGRMMRTSGELDPIVVSAIQKLRCEHQTYPHTRGLSYLPEWESTVHLFGLTVMLIDLSDFFFWSVGSWGGLRQPFSRSPWSIQNLRAYQQFRWCSFFGCDGDGRGSEPAATRILARGRNEVLGMGAGSRTPFVEEFVRRLLRF